MRQVRFSGDRLDKDGAAAEPPARRDAVGVAHRLRVEVAPEHISERLSADGASAAAADGVSAADDQGSLSLRLSDRRIHVLQGLLRENKVPMMAQDWRHKAAESAHQRQEMARAAQLHNKRCFEHEQLRKCFGLPHNATPTKRENCTID